MANDLVVVGVDILQLCAFGSKPDSLDLQDLMELHKQTYASLNFMTLSIVELKQSKVGWLQVLTHLACLVLWLHRNGALQVLFHLQTMYSLRCRGRASSHKRLTKRRIESMH